MKSLVFVWTFNEFLGDNFIALRRLIIKFTDFINGSVHCFRIDGLVKYAIFLKCTEFDRLHPSTIFRVIHVGLILF